VKLPNSHLLIRLTKNILEEKNLAHKVFDSIAQNKLYRYAVQRNIDSYIIGIKENKKYNIILETTNVCNAKCIMCPHACMQRNAEIMSDETFTCAVNRIKEADLQPVAFILNGFGEPLTDKKIFRRIKSIKQEFKKSMVKIYSNFNIATDESINDIVHCGLDEINISFNGFDKGSYENTMGINYERTLTNTDKLLKAKNQKNSHLKVRLSMALVSYNENDAQEFIRDWSRQVDSVSVNRIHTYGGQVKDASGKLKINFNKPVFPCKYLWNTIVIGVTGDLYLCCLDYNGRYSFGNIKKDKILDMFYSERFERIRKLHYERKIDNLGICKYCYTPYRNGVEWFVNELY
jgi:radical SAM protein with 4Fe4S-binding SPASM domain